MLRGVLRNFYSKSNAFKHKPGTDMRDAVATREYFNLGADSRMALEIKSTHMKYKYLSYLAIGLFVGISVSRMWNFEERIEAAYLDTLPARTYEAADYDFKFWELPLTVKHDRLGELISTESVCVDRYVLLYHAKTSDSQMAMQRFSRLKKHIMLRKNVNFESVFVSMDEEVNVQKLHEYVQLYSNDVLAAFTPDEEIRSSMEKIFQNLGCVYVLAKDTGNVICIVDPRKLPISVMSVTIITNISKHEDRLISEDITKRSMDFRVGKQAIFAPKTPTY
mmetsp:Transcript_12638/g.23643  ORF Transcript_12638/g.23643 Transcript_12638/m.23643 type:complete len:278 (+) Transcript_12638:27-860(+)